MTDKTPQIQSEIGTASLPLLADHPSLLRVRVLPAEFSRLLGVSKQSVSRWVAAGKVTVNPVDGRIDVQEGVKQVLRNTDPGRLRSRILRQSVEEVTTLRKNLSEAEDRILALEEQIAELRSLVDYLEGFWRGLDRENEEFKASLRAKESELRATPDSSTWDALLEEIFDDAAIRADEREEQTNSGAGDAEDS